MMPVVEHLQFQAGTAARLETAARTLYAEGKLANPEFTLALALLPRCRGYASITIWQLLEEEAPELLAVLWEKAGLKKVEVG